MKRSPFIAYIDETGDHGLDAINATMPIFAVCAALYAIDEYIGHDCPKFTDIKFRLWYHDNVVFHSRAIRRRLPPFQRLVDPECRAMLIDAINSFFDESKVVLIAAAIDKHKHKAQYRAPENPYYLALQFLLERIFGQIHDKGGADAETVCIFESRGAAEDAELLLWFTEITGGRNQWGRALPFRAQFASKQTNMVGLQVADLAAYPIARYVEAPSSPRLEWAHVEPRLRRSASGKLEGWGLKVFPAKS